jgi:PEP-CTERM motif
MTLKKVVAIALLAAAGPALAAPSSGCLTETQSLGTVTDEVTWFGNTFTGKSAKCFSDDYTFSLGATSDLIGAVWDVFFDWRDVDFTSVTLRGPSGYTSAQWSIGSADLGYAGSFSGLGAGAYTLNVQGTVGAGFGTASYQGGLMATTVAAPVPEPQTYAMFALGLGLLGWAVRRRQQG